jgi:hypothetical protein
VPPAAASDLTPFHGERSGGLWKWREGKPHTPARAKLCVRGNETVNDFSAFVSHDEKSFMGKSLDPFLSVLSFSADTKNNPGKEYVSNIHYY